MTGQVGEALRAALGSAALVGSSVRPSGGEEAVRAIEILAATRTPWCPGGGDSDPKGGLRVAAPAAPSLIDFWPEDLVARVAAGVTCADLEARLRPLGLRIAATPAAPGSTTLGGAYARADRGLVSGLGRSLREVVLGLRAVDGGARPLAAGARVVKNVAGYDLTRLHHGAGGCFGLVLDLLVRLEAIPPQTAAWFVPASADDAAAMLTRLRRPATALEPFAQVWVSPGAARRLGLADAGGIVVAADGQPETVSVWSRAVSEAADARGVEWTRVRDLGVEDGGRVLRAWPNPAGRARWIQWEASLRADGIDAACVVDLVGGEVRFLVPAGVAEPPRRAPASGPAAAVVRRLKTAFDPHGLLPDPPGPWSWDGSA